MEECRTMPLLSIVVPTYNEVENIPILLEEVKKPSAK